LTSGIQLIDVSKVYTIAAERVEALRSVSITVPQGTLAAITGKSGAGKSTLLHLVGMLDRPSKGHVILNGVDVSAMNDLEASSYRNATVGFVFQMNNLLSEFSALENVMMPGLIAGAKKSQVSDRAGTLLKAVGLSQRMNHRPGELSGGEQQRVAIARALLMEPSVLLAD
jgi:lipoprotein-releasing system ATP-binding protein